MQKKSFYILLGITVVMVAAAVLFQRPSKDYSGTLGLQVPDLGKRADQVRSIVIRTADDELRLERHDDGWVASNKDDYPADADRIRTLVFGLSHLERLEKKTSNPERLGRLELTGVEESGSKAVEITLLTGDSDKLADVLVGKTDDFQSNDYSRYFVRDADDPQAWLVQGNLPPVPEDFGDWLEQKLLAGVEGTGFQSITVTHPDGAKVTVFRDSADNEDFQLAGLSSGESIDSQYSVNQFANTLKRLSLDDVQTVDTAGDKAAVLDVEALTFNGVRITARFDHREPDYGVALSATYEPEQDRSENESGAQDDSAGGDTAQKAGGEEGDDGKGDVEKDEPEPLSGPQLADKLNERWQGRLFIVSQYALDALKAPRADLVKKAEDSGQS